MMMRSFIVFATLALSACGFQPVYAPSQGNLESGLISIEQIDGRSGHNLRRALQEQLAIGLPGITEPTTLNIILKEDLQRLAFEPDGAASRSSVIATARYTLVSESLSTNGRVSIETSFNVPNGVYEDIAAQSGASDRAMRLLAQRVVEDLRLKLTTTE